MARVRHAVSTEYNRFRIELETCFAEVMNDFADRVISSCSDDGPLAVRRRTCRYAGVVDVFS
ncbi:MAG: hypothetical protein OXQ84_21420 [bacterium]|nr:hypothetical protein [bacterium]